ncbi:MAG: hypothetical protein U0176_12995 [Bacteroidia bacterium]
MRRHWLVWAIALVCCGCGNRYQERTGIPIWQGMRVNEAEEWSELEANAALWESEEVDGIVLELSLRADSAGLPIVSTFPDEQVIQKLPKKSLAIVLATSNLKELYPDELQVTDAPWFAQLESEVNRLLSALGPAHPQRLIIAGAWGDYPMNRAGWASLVNGLRRQWPGVKFSLGGRPELVAENGFAALSDEIAIDYPPMAGEEQRSSCRSTNLDIAELGIASGKPIFIFRANVIGNPPLPQFQNRLRFWREEATIAGMCLNSLYPFSPMRDAKTYYGLADNPELGEFLKEYQSRFGD